MHKCRNPDELGRKFEDGIENFINWHVELH